jgi:hypothetical protein
MTYTVIQWATGAVGTNQLRGVLDNPELELVGCFVYSEQKAGRDVGELIGAGPTGVIATNDRQEILDLDADVVLHAPLAASLDELDADVTALLASGKNVISTAAYFCPEARGPEATAKLEQACLAGNASLHGSGIEPGFVFDRLAPALTGMCMDFRHMKMVEYANTSHIESKALIHDAIGMGKQLDEIRTDTPFGQYFASFFGEVITGVARTLSLELGELEIGLHVEPATRDLSCAFGEVPKGTVAGVRYWVAAPVNGREMLRIEINWFVEPGLPGFPVPEHNCAWNIEIEGDPSGRFRFDLLPTLDHQPGQEYADPIFVATAAVPINTIAEVCAAKPGIVHGPVWEPWTPAATAADGGVR